MQIEILKNSTKPILITGETGTGKSRLAKKIHQESNYRDRPFIKLNLSAMSDSLFESELFGHVKGSFTGAISNKLGPLAKALDGTVFMDEIGELSLEKQVKILHLLDDGHYLPVGSDRPQMFKGRFIFATNRNLEKLVNSGEFRQDLFFRIRFCQVSLPPLREHSQVERKQEVLTMFNNMKVAHSRYNLKLCMELVEKLVNYSWPGNYRELENTLEYLISSERDSLNAEDLPSWIQSHKTTLKTKVSQSLGYYQAVDAFEKEYFKGIMWRYSGQINKSALEIGLSKVTLISKLKKHGIDRKQYRIRDAIA